jgi:hypothetical protein
MIPTAKEIVEKYRKIKLSGEEYKAEDILIEFARIHVEAALKAASNKAHIQMDEHDLSCSVNKQSILNAYSLDLIK